MTGKTLRDILLGAPGLKFEGPDPRELLDYLTGLALVAEGNGDLTAEVAASLLSDKANQSDLTAESATRAATVAAPSDRPGDAPNAFSAQIYGASVDKVSLDKDDVVQTSLGDVFRGDGAHIVAIRAPVSLAAGTWNVTAIFKRSAAITDDSDATVSLRVAWLDSSKQLSSILTDQKIADIDVTDTGVTETLTGSVSRSASGDVISPPNDAVYACFYLQVFATTGTLDTEVLRADFVESAVLDEASLRRVLIGSGQYIDSTLLAIINGDPDIIFAGDFKTDSAISIGFGTMETAVTLERDAPGLYLNTSGKYTSFASGKKRFGDRGILIEPSRENLIEHSAEIDDARWTLQRSSTSSDGVEIAGMPATKLIGDTTAGSTHGAQQSVSVSDATEYTASVIAGPDEDEFLGLQLFGPPFSDQPRVVFNLTDGSFTIQRGNCDARATKVDGGYLCELTATSVASGNATAFIMTAPATSVFFAGDDTSGINVAHVQFEAGATSTTPIITSDLPVTRPADDVQFGSNEWWPQDEGTIFIRGEFTHESGNYIVGAEGSADTPARMNGDAGQVAASNTGVLIEADTGGVSFGLGNTVEILSTWDADGRAIAMNGGVVASDNAAARAVTISRIGARGPATPQSVINGYVEIIAVWQTKLEQ